MPIDQWLRIDRKIMLFKYAMPGVGIFLTSASRDILICFRLTVTIEDKRLGAILGAPVSPKRIQT